MTVGKTGLFAGVVGSAVLFNVCILLRELAPVPAAVYTLVFLASVPGLLSMWIMHAAPVDGWRYGYFVLCLSLVLVMGSGLAVNWLLPELGVGRPLAAEHVLPCLDILLVVLLAVAWKRHEGRNAVFQMERRRAIPAYALTALVFPLLAALGAASLNGGGGNAFTILLLLGVAAYFALVFMRRRPLHEGAVRFTLLCIAAALLLMTSLRGWFITGHDIQREYVVFEMTKADWHWDIADLRDPYNSCLSITILPTMLAGLVHVDDVMIYKAVFQFIFAFSAVAVYLMVRGFGSQRAAVLSTYFYVAFPTFFGDMPMLNRQEIAFVLVGGMLLAALSEDLPIRSRRVLFGVLGLGVVVSHYSTTYSLIVILSGAVLLLWVLRLRGVHAGLMTVAERLHLAPPECLTRRDKPVINAMLIALLVVSALTWSVLLTHTGGSLRDVASRAVSGISGNLQNDRRSSDTTASLWNWSRPNRQEAFAEAVSSAVARRGTDAGEYFAPSSYEVYPLTLAPESTLPLTRVGAALAHVGVDPYVLNNVLRQGWAKLLQVLVLVGLTVMLAHRGLGSGMSADYVGVCIASVGFIGVLVIMPSLSVDYGLLRAFQQTLMVLAFPAAVGMWVVEGGRSRRPGYRVGGGLIALSFFLSTSGVAPESTGGFAPQLHLRNEGIYYETYLHRTESASMAWLARQPSVHRVGGRSGVQADQFGALKLRTSTGVDAEADLLPEDVRRSAYVYLDYSNVVHRRAFLLSGNDSYGYDYPIEFLDENKDLLYSNRESRVYR